MRFNLRRSGPWIGVGGILAEVFIAFPAFFSIIKVPGYGIAMIVGMLALQVVAVTRVARSRPERCVYIPAVGLAAYFALIYVGAHWWGWSV